MRQVWSVYEMRNGSVHPVARFDGPDSAENYEAAESAYAHLLAHGAYVGFDEYPDFTCETVGDAGLEGRAGVAGELSVEFEWDALGLTGGAVSLGDFEWGLCRDRGASEILGEWGDLDGLAYDLYAYFALREAGIDGLDAEAVLLALRGEYLATGASDPALCDFAAGVARRLALRA